MWIAGLSGALALAIPVGMPAQGHEHEHAPDAGIPASVREEHAELHAALESAMERKDAVGAAARALARVLHPHFVREEEIALPPLGALAALSRGEMPANAAALIAMTDTLERELPGMLNEHRAIAAAVATLEAAAVREGAEAWVRFARQLRLHARTEEEVYYPGALVVGRMLKCVAKT